MKILNTVFYHSLEINNMPLTAEQKEAIMAARGDSGRVINGGNMSWQVTLAECKPFTFITDQCKTPDDVESAMAEKFNKETVELKLL